MTTREESGLNALLHTIAWFADYGANRPLRAYQRQVAEAVLDSVKRQRGDTFVVLFPRQSGKNEIQAQLEAYLLALGSSMNAQLVQVSPTYQPQTLNAMRRLEMLLERNAVTRGRWEKESGFIYRMNQARIYFLSGSPTANVVGATASTLLSCDEAQDVLISKWDKDFAPMAASTNATRVFWGTAWTSRTLLARELRAARQAEQADGRRRVFMLTADDVRREVPAYGKFVDGQVARLGRNHPMVKTQFFSEEIDAEGGLFSKVRLALMQGQHAPQEAPEEDKIYALLLDVAGEDEGSSDLSASASSGQAFGNSDLLNSRRDSTALTVVEVDLTSLADELIKAPSYKVVRRYEWIGTKHTQLYGQIKALARHWQARYLVVDATGVGAGLASFLDSALPHVVIPFTFTQKSKSDLGWNFLGVIETGRFKDYLLKVEEDLQATELQTTFWRQAELCTHVVLDGPGKLMRWGVPDGTRDPATGELVHDDLLISAALCSVLDAQEWGLAKSDVIGAVDPLQGFSDVF